MIYTQLTLKAMEIAYNAHHGQKDKCGAPYVFHPYHLAEQMDSEYKVCAALLHDVAEDTDITFGQLSDIFPAEIVDAVRLLTHDDDTEYSDYISRIKENDIAKAVKLADLKHNSNTDRASLSQESEEKIKTRLKKYNDAIKVLSEN